MKTVSFSKEAGRMLRQLQKSAPKDAKSIARRIMELRSSGVTPHCKLLQNSSPPLHRSRCGNYRIVYALHPDRLEVLTIGHRREIYTVTRNKKLT